jgi:enediyne biosynthesis protein E3
MEIVQSIFREVQDSYSENISLAELYKYLDSFDIEFRSIAYEAASMCVALGDLKSDNQLKRWFEFAQQAALHATQIHVGLGWALAQLQIDPLPFMGGLHPMMRYRVADGYGYYEGIFRKRKGVLSQQRPEWDDATAMDAYDQGLGRSMWYLNNGNIEEAKKLIEKFPVSRQADLWRGLGIAISYAGGCSEEYLLQIISLAGDFKTQLAAGCVMALVSRKVAGFISDDAALVCRVWCNKSVEDALSLYQPDLLSSAYNKESAYSSWIQNIEESF